MTSDEAITAFELLTGGLPGAAAFPRVALCSPPDPSDKDGYTVEFPCEHRTLSDLGEVLETIQRMGPDHYLRYTGEVQLRQTGETLREGLELWLVITTDLGARNA